MGFKKLDLQVIFIIIDRHSLRMLKNEFDHDVLLRKFQNSPLETEQL